MTDVEMRFFGGLALGGNVLDGLRSKKGQALLCYLAVTGQAHAREHLAGLLWPESPEANARASLRKVLSAIGKAAPHCLDLARHTVALNHAASVWIDVVAFEKLAATTTDVEHLQEAASLFQGDFLAGFQLPDAPAFDRWVLNQRARLREKVAALLHTLAGYYAERREYEAAVVYAKRLVDLEPWREDGHRQLIEYLARSGQRGAALRQYHTCRLILAEELAVEPSAGTTALYQRVLEGAVGPPQPDRPPPTTGSPHNLPAALTPFVGREQEVDYLGRLLADERTRLISIVGLGGMGKTRIAREAGRRQIGDFAAGVFFVPLVQVHSPQNIPNAIADAIGFQFHSRAAPLQQLLNYLRHKQMLLILDNFEHLLAGCAVIADILRGAPGVKIMVTTRERLPLRGATHLNLLGMEVGQWHHVAQASAAGSVRLFLQSARRIRPAFTLDDETLPLVLAICRLVQGMPLAIELAAAWVDTFTLEEIKTGIEDEMEFLAVDYVDTPARHRNMRHLLEQSLRILGDRELDTFLRLSVFQGGFTREAAGEIAHAGLRTLATLVGKSLLQRDVTGQYAIHELLRQFAESRLREDPDRYHQVRRDHARYYCSFLASLENQLNTGDGKSACAQIEAAWGNVRFAWEWACRQGMWEELILAEYALFLFREYQNRFQEVEQMYEFAVSRLNASEPGPYWHYFFSAILRSQAWTAVRYGQIARGLQLGTDALTHLQASDLPLRRGGNDPRAPLVVSHTLMGHFEKARHVGNEMLRFHRRRGDHISEILAYYALSSLELAEGHYRRLRQLEKGAAAAFAATGHKYLYAYLLNNVGNAERALGNYGEANRLFRNSYDLMRDLGSTEGMTTALNNVANIALLREEYDEAQTILEQNIVTYRDLGDPGSIALTLEALGQIAFQQGDFVQAATLYEEALQTAGPSLRGVTLSILLCVSRLFLELDLPAQAGQILRVALDHPASNQELGERARHQLQTYGLDREEGREPVSLECLVADVVEQLRRQQGPGSERR